jgi:hypothetical protein
MAPLKLIINLHENHQLSIDAVKFNSLIHFPLKSDISWKKTKTLDNQKVSVRKKVSVRVSIDLFHYYYNYY